MQLLPCHTTAIITSISLQTALIPCRADHPGPRSASPSKAVLVPPRFRIFVRENQDSSRKIWPGAICSLSKFGGKPFSRHISSAWAQLLIIAGSGWRYMSALTFPTLCFAFRSRLLHGCTNAQRAVREMNTAIASSSVYLCRIARISLLDPNKSMGICRGCCGKSTRSSFRGHGLDHNETTVGVH